MGDISAVVVNGLLIGAVYALVALGLNLIFGVLRVVNFAHGAFLGLAMYLVYLLSSEFGVHPYLAAIPTVASLFVLGVLTQRFLLRRVLDGPESSHVLLTLGLLIILQNLLQVGFGPTPRFVSTGWEQTTVDILDFNVAVPRVVAAVVAAAGTGLIFAMLRWTRLGKSVRAAAQDRTGAALTGINVPQTYEVTVGLSLAAVGLAGVTLAPLYYVTPGVGDVFLLTAFTAVVLGGLGSTTGAALAGLIVGLVESLGNYYLPGSWESVIVYSLLFVVLVVRPAGLFGSATEARA